MNIPEVVAAAVASLALLGGGVGLYTTAKTNDSVIALRVETLITLSEKNSSEISELSKVVGTLQVKQVYTDKAHEEFMYDMRELANDIRRVSRRPLDEGGK